LGCPNWGFESSRKRENGFLNDFREREIVGSWEVGNYYRQK
jgi:hypothetical protein